MMTHHPICHYYASLSLQITSDEARPSRCRWLVAEALSYLPVVGHINGWSDLHGCGKDNMVEFMSKGVSSLSHAAVMWIDSSYIHHTTYTCTH